MVQETGVVESLTGEYAFIKAERAESCGHCASKSLCHSIDEKEHVIVQTINTIGAKVGDTVRFEIPVNSFLKASLLVYAVPLIALLIGSLVGRLLYPYFSESMSKDGISAISAFMFLIVSIFLVRMIGKGAKDEKYIPKIIQIIDQ
jgi:sigma-E factor negative regulatory protein RseC